jgi:hypothetical protein
LKARYSRDCGVEMNHPRIGHTIHATDGHTYTITERTDSVAMAERVDRPRQGKVFSFTELKEIEPGVWKEMRIK